jgi:hypothetical protein
MPINNEKVDEMTLALLYLTTLQGQARVAGVEEPQLGCPRSPARERLHPRASNQGEVLDANRGRSGAVKAPV